MSIRVRNFETNHLKVNVADGNAIDIAAIVVWQVRGRASWRLSGDQRAAMRNVFEDFVGAGPARRSPE